MECNGQAVRISDGPHLGIDEGREHGAHTAHNKGQAHSGAGRLVGHDTCKPQQLLSALRITAAGHAPRLGRDPACHYTV